VRAPLAVGAGGELDFGACFSCFGAFGDCCHSTGGGDWPRAAAAERSARTTAHHAPRAAGVPRLLSVSFPRIMLLRGDAIACRRDAGAIGFHRLANEPTLGTDSR
jgi:hypothetical protein